MNGLKGFRGNMVAALPERVPAGFALAVGNIVQLFLVEIHKTQVLHGSLLLVVERVGYRIQRHAKPVEDAGPAALQ
jgi:hypothetical protein